LKFNVQIGTAWVCLHTGKKHSIINCNGDETMKIVIGDFWQLQVDRITLDRNQSHILSILHSYYQIYFDSRYAYFSR